ncbi:unnamed protein product [Symbiodinium sp. CCMP2592]|nr:unnamed protein product [Symbiodinium sp. CCMP2592]
MIARAYDYAIGQPPLASPQVSPLDQFRQIAASINEHTHSPNHPDAWTAKLILARIREAIAVFSAHLAFILSSLELRQWKASLIECTQVIDHFVTETLQDGIAHLDCPAVMEIAELLHDALIAYARQDHRFTGRMASLELQLGWTIGNKFAKTLIPDGYSVHCGFANCIWLNLVSICNHCIAAMTPTEIAGGIPAFSLNLSFLLVDKTVECYYALKALFTRAIAVTTFNCRVYNSVNGLADWFVCIALPASIADSLMNGTSTNIPTPLGQLNAQFSADAALRKLSHWYRQNKFTAAQNRELVKLIVFRPLLTMIDTRLKCPEGTGGFLRYHNCSFVCNSWCLTIDSQHDPIEDKYWYTLDGLVRQCGIVLELPTMTVESLSALIHNSCYEHWYSSESVHRHCTLPLTHLQIEGSPQMYLLTADCDEVAAEEIASSGAVSSTPSLSSSMTSQEYDIVVTAAAAIAKKRKGN